MSFKYQIIYSTNEVALKRKSYLICKIPVDQRIRYSLFSNWNHLIFYHPLLKIWKSMPRTMESCVICLLFIPGFVNKNNVGITICERNDTFQLIQRRERGWKRVGYPFLFFTFSRLNFLFFTAVSATVIRQFSELCPRFGTSETTKRLPRTYRLISSRNVTGNIVSRSTKMCWKNRSKVSVRYTKEEIEIKVARR